MSDKIMIYVAAHKPASKIWGDDKGLRFIHVGSALSQHQIKDCVRDDTGDNISKKNPLYCELTAHYWIWKNDNTHSYVGLCHYRRFLSKHEYALNSKSNLLSSYTVEEMLNGVDIILPTPKRKSEKNSLYDTIENLEKDPSYKSLKIAIQKVAPDYLAELEAVFMDKKMSFGNILVTSKKLFDDYSAWLFSILDQVERDYASEKREIEPRLMGFLSEWLLNVWVRHNNLRVRYVPVHATESNINAKYVMKVMLERFGYTV